MQGERITYRAFILDEKLKFQKRHGEKNFLLLRIAKRRAVELSAEYSAPVEVYEVIGRTVGKMVFRCDQASIFKQS